MTDDDARVAHLMGEPSDALDPGEREVLDDLIALLADRAVWDVPPGGLEARVVEAVSAASASGRAG